MTGHARRHFAISCAKLAELIEMPFGCGLGWAKGRKHVLGHIDATWQIQLNRSSAAVMQPYVKLL